MLCPYCHVEYTASNPCWCHPRTYRQADETQDNALRLDAADKDRVSSLKPTGLENPFWK